MSPGYQTKPSIRVVRFGHTDCLAQSHATDIIPIIQPSVYVVHFIHWDTLAVHCTLMLHI